MAEDDDGGAAAAAAAMAVAPAPAPAATPGPSSSVRVESAAPSSSFPLSVYRNEIQLRSQLLCRLQQDLRACDVQVGLFISAAQNYRCYSVLRPRPSPDLIQEPDFVNDEEQWMQDMKNILLDVPSLDVVQRRLEQGQSVPVRALKLLHWIILDNSAGLRLRTLPKSQFSDVLHLSEEKTAGVDADARPTHIFEIYNNKTAIWQKRLASERKAATEADKTGPKAKVTTEKAEVKTMFGFHGSRVENFHSILSHGLQQHLSTNAMFGQGIYLSTELNVSMMYSHLGQVWDRSRVSRQAQCNVLCEVIDHEDVKLNHEDPRRSLVEDSEAGKVPEKYLIVRNNDLICSRYLLVFSKAAPDRPRQEAVHVFPEWLRKNAMLYLLIFYGVVLLAVGLANSTWMRRILYKHGLLDFGRHG